MEADFHVSDDGFTVFTRIVSDPHASSSPTLWVRQKT